MATPSIWAQILTAAGLQVTPNAQEALACWSQSEGGLSEYNTPGQPSSGSINNPFNITARYGQPGTAQGGTQGNIQYFKTLANGIAAVGQWLKTEAYLAPVRAALNSGDITQMYTAINGVSGTLGGQSTPIPGYPPVLQQYIASGGKTPASGVYSTGVNPPPVTESGTGGGTTPPAGGTGAGGITVGGTTGTTPPAAVDYTVPAGGWDWSVIPPDQMKGAMGAINLLDGLSKNPEQLSSMQTQIEEDYPQYAYLWDIPAFRTILTYGALAQLTSDRVFGLIQATPYWHDHSTGAMWWAYKTQSSPKDAQAMIGNTEAYVRRLAATLGIDPSNAEVQKLSRQAMQDSWTTSGTPNEYADSTIIQSLVNHANVYRQAGAPAGDVATLSDYLQTLSSHYMLGLDRSAIDALIQKVMKKDTGESNFMTGAEATLKQELQQQAIARYGKTYPGIANAISQGDTTAQFLQNYRNTTATIQTITASTGMTLTPAQVRTLALQLTNQNAANAALTGESTLNRDTITTAVANIWGAEPAQEQAGTTAAGATPTPKGDVAILEDSLSKLAGQYTYPMSQQQLTTMVDQYMKGDNGSPDFLSGAQAYFENWLKDWATNHYKNLGPGVMAAAIAKGETPAQFMNVLAATQSEAYKTAASLGIKLSGNDLYNIALQVTKKNAENGETGTDAAITDPEITRGITALANIKKQGVNTGGDVSTLADSYQKIAGQYLQAMTPAQLDTYLQNSMGTDVGQGNFTTGATSAFEQQMKNAAIAKYPYMKEQIAEGTTPAQFIAPYATAASNLLEIAPTVAQSELANGKLSFALEQKDPKTGAPTPMSIADFKQELMSNPQYGYQFTDQAVKSAYTIGAELARSLGVISGGVA